MNAVHTLLRRTGGALLALCLLAGNVFSQISGNTGPQDGWGYTGMYLELPAGTASSERGCVTATAGGVYVGAWYSGKMYIEKYEPTGAFVAKFTRQFGRITGLASDKEGNVYAFDGNAGKGYAMAADGTDLFSFGNGVGSNDGQFSGTDRSDVWNTLAVNSAGVIYVADCSNHRIQMFSPTGAFTGKFGSYGSLPGQFGNVVANVAVGPRDEVVAIDWNAWVTRFTASGEYSAKATNTDYYWWNRCFSVSPDGFLFVGTRENGQSNISAPNGTLLDISTMYSDYWKGYYVNNQRAGLANLMNGVVGQQATERGSAFDSAGNLWLVRYNTITSGSYSVERFERKMRFDSYKPTKVAPMPLIVSAIQQAGSQTVNISYRVDDPDSASVETALVGWLGGVRNWSHLVVPSVGSGSFTATGEYFWSDMYDQAARIEDRYPLSDSINGSCIDLSGNLYVATDRCIRKISPSGNVTTLAGRGGYSGYTDGEGATARFSNPNPWGGMCVDANGTVYVSEWDGCVIRKITSAGVVSTLAGVWGSGGTTNGKGSAARFYYPTQLTTDPDGNVYVAEWYGCDIRKITPDGTVTTVASNLSNLMGLARDAAGNFYVAPKDQHRIMKVAADGTVTVFAGSDTGVSGYVDGTGTAARFTSPRAISIDGSGNLYVNQENNTAVRKITPQGVVTTITRTSGPVVNVVSDAEGNLYTAESYQAAGIGRMARKATRSTATSYGIVSESGALGTNVATGTLQPVVATGTQQSVSWDVSKDLPGMSFASLSFEVLAKETDRQLIGMHYVTIPGDSTNTSSLKISNRPVDDADLSDLWLWLLAKRDPRVKREGNTVVFTEAGLAEVANAPKIYNADASDTTSTLVHSGGSGGADNNWSSWGTTTVRGRAFAYTLLNCRPVTAAEVNRASAGRYSLSSVSEYSVVQQSQ